MKKIITVLFIAIAINVSGQIQQQQQLESLKKGGNPGSSKPLKVRQKVGLDTLILELSKQYSDAMLRLAEDDITDIKITELAVSFNSSNVTSVNGNIGILIFKTDVTKSNTKESTITFTLKEDTTYNKSFLRKKNEYSLADMIYNTAKTFNNINSMSQIGKLKSDSFEIEIEFAVQWDGEATIGGEIFKIGAEIVGSTERVTKHTIKLTFGVKK